MLSDDNTTTQKRVRTTMAIRTVRSLRTPSVVDGRVQSSVSHPHIDGRPSDISCQFQRVPFAHTHSTRARAVCHQLVDAMPGGRVWRARDFHAHDGGGRSARSATKLRPYGAACGRTERSKWRRNLRSRAVPRWWGHGAALNGANHLRSGRKERLASCRAVEAAAREGREDPLGEQSALLADAEGAVGALPLIVVECR